MYRIQLFLITLLLAGCATTMSKTMYLEENLTKEAVRQKLGVPAAASTVTKPNGDVWEMWEYPKSQINVFDSYDTRVLFVNGKLAQWGRKDDISIR